MLMDIPIDSLPKTSPLTIKRLKSLNINTLTDLLNYFPFRYENYSLISAINKIQPGEIVTLKGTISKSKFEITKKGTRIQKFILQDSSDQVEIVWFNQPYLLRLINPGTLLSVAGLVNKFKNRFVLEPKEYEILSRPDQETIHTGRLVPIYPEKKGLSSKTIREKIHFTLKNFSHQIDELLPKEIIRFNDLVSLPTAYFDIHFPKSNSTAQKARARLAFDELFLIQLSASLIRKEWDKEKVISHFILKASYKKLLDDFRRRLPFELTNAQKRSLNEMVNDLIKPRPMNRFLQGDVGSGKTVVAALGAYLAFLNGYQTLFMAPTEILANQHYQTVSSLFSNLPLKIGLHTKSIKIDKKNKYDIVLGTHALINEKLSFKKVGLVIVDEQHRFGVVQRSLLKSKGFNPHLLTMTATPIPRTVALTLYGELDLSVIDEMPKGRLPVKSYLVPEAKKMVCYQWIKRQIKERGNQVFIICPLVEESEVETMLSVKAAKKEYQYLMSEVFSDFKIGLIHGKLKSKEKDKMMAGFKNKKIDILVSTSVVEVGIDIPNASIMIIEGAERFGLAQLHQLRGRIGRGSTQSYCFLFTSDGSKINTDRLNFFSHTTSGNELALYDLKHRGPGNVFGTKQSGFLDLRIASLTDYPLIKKTKNALLYFINKYPNLDLFPQLKKIVKKRREGQVSKD